MIASPGNRRLAERASCVEPGLYLASLGLASIFPSCSIVQINWSFQQSPPRVSHRSPEMDLRIAIHEAGYAVVGRTLGLPVSGTTIGPPTASGLGLIATLVLGLNKMKIVMVRAQFGNFYFA